MAESRKIQISLPEQLLKEVDSIVSMEKTNRSEFVRRTIRLYIRERRRIEVRDKLKRGYQEMAEINIRLSEIWFDADNDLQLKYIHAHRRRYYPHCYHDHNYHSKPYRIISQYIYNYWVKYGYG